MVKPSRIIILLSYVGLMTGLVMLMSPEEVQLGEHFSFKVFTFKDLLPSRPKKVDLSAIKALEGKIDSLESSSPDSLAEQSEEKKEKLVPKKLNKNIQFPQDNQTVLDNFFASLQREASNQLVRIVHYGDSQIEGDRMTEYLRNRLQKKFGGCGVGTVPPTEIKGIRSTIAFEATENFVRYEIFGAVKKPSLHRDYGHLGSYHKFAYQRPDQEEPIKEVAGTLSFTPPYIRTYDLNKQVEKITIGYRNSFAPLNIDAKLNGNLIVKDSFPSRNQFRTLVLDGAGKFKKLELQFRSKGDPEIYGVSFDCQQGIALDNAPFRGSSGIEFTSVNKDFYRQQVEKMNIKLMVIQFGVNVIPYVRKEYNYHKKLMAKQLKFLKSLSPELDILVIGPSDMARKQGTEFASYPNIPALRDAMKAAAFESGCAFWDLYEAMGGEDAIIAWVDSKPALANPDYTHFTRKGAKLVGEILYNALLKEYSRYLRKAS